MKRVEKLNGCAYPIGMTDSQKHLDKINELVDAVNAIAQDLWAVERSLKKEPECEHEWYYKPTGLETCSKCGKTILDCEKPAKKDGLAERLNNKFKERQITGGLGYIFDADALSSESRAWAVEVVEKIPDLDDASESIWGYEEFRNRLIKRLKESA